MRVTDLDRRSCGQQGKVCEEHADRDNEDHYHDICPGQGRRSKTKGEHGDRHIFGAERARVGDDPPRRRTETRHDRSGRSVEAVTRIMLEAALDEETAEHF